MGKIKKEKGEESLDVSIKQEEGEISYEDKLQNISVIANPLAPKKLTKKCYKLIKKAVKHKTYLRNGLRDVQTRLRKGETGLVLFAGDVNPVDIMVHLPGVCEEKNIPYCYIPSRADLGAAMGVKRGSLMVLIREHDDYQELYNECASEIKNLACTL